VQITYDSTAVKYEDLLIVFFDIHNPTTKNRQGNILLNYLYYDKNYQIKRK